MIGQFFAFRDFAMDSDKKKGWFLPHAWRCLIAGLPRFMGLYKMNPW
jgi:hypothetical protein